MKSLMKYVPFGVSLWILAFAALPSPGADLLLTPNFPVTSIELEAPPEAGTHHFRAVVDADDLTPEYSTVDNQQTLLYSVVDAPNDPEPGALHLWAWGHNGMGPLGDGTTEDRHEPTRIGADGDWASVVAGLWHTVGIRTDGTLWAWGHNYYGQLGDGTTEDRREPIRIIGRRNRLIHPNSPGCTMPVRTGEASLGK